MQLSTTIVQVDLMNQQASECDVSAIQYDFSHYLYWIHVDLNDLAKAQTILNTLGLSVESLSLSAEKVTDEFFPFLQETEEAICFQVRCLTEVTLNSRHDVNYSHLTVYLTDRYCLTLSHGLPVSLATLKAELKTAVRYAETPGFLLFLIFDNVINEYLETLLEFERLSDAIDLDFRHISTSTYQKVILLKRRVIKIKRYIAIISDMMMRLSGRKIHVISNSCRESLVALLTHCQMVMTEADAIRDAINSSLDSINNALMGRMNETMRILTVYTLLFMPLTLITGIYGMNFQHMPELSWRYGYPIVLGVMAVCAALMVYAFKRRRWI